MYYVEHFENAVQILKILDGARGGANRTAETGFRCACLKQLVIKCAVDYVGNKKLERLREVGKVEKRGLHLEQKIDKI